MAALVRNMFLHIRQQDEQPQIGQKRFEGPTSAALESGAGNLDPLFPATDDDALRTDSSTQASESEGLSPRSSCNECEGISASSIGCDSEMDCGETAADGDNSVGSASELSAPEVTQRQLDELSQTVMAIWARIREVESSLEDALPEPNVAALAQRSPTDTALHEPQGCADIAPLESFDAPSMPSMHGVTGLKMDAAAPPFTPCCKEPSRQWEVQHVLSSVNHLLIAAPGVTGVEVDVGRRGTLATISIELDSSSCPSTRRDQIVRLAKSLLLDSAETSQSVYVLGYDAVPFQDVSESVFAATLASMPYGCESIACWETYQTGTCPRGKTCKWRHPGKQELKPVRVEVC